mmetsp:Transcript_4872/g.9015  ORF Transcript_4872/g.9015 Transcript_4872/m.9015 type:complete len:89 (+) Transcript_4872:325-591(+)
MSNPDIVMYAQAPTSAADEGTKPAAAVAVGNAKIPAPIVVPATKAAAPSVEPALCTAEMVPCSFLLYSSELNMRGTSPVINSGKRIRS